MSSAKREPSEWRLDYGDFARMRRPDFLSPGKATLYKFCAAARRGEPIPDAVLAEVTEGLERILLGERADKALSVAKPRGKSARRNPDAYYRCVNIAASVLAEKQWRPRATIPAIADSFVPVFKEKASFIEDCYYRYRPEAVLALQVTEALDANELAEASEAISKLRQRSGYDWIGLPRPRYPAPR